MSSIFYYYKNGVEVGQWPGKGYRDAQGRSRRKGQMFLGKVIDKSKNLFWKRKEGYFRFNTITETIEPPSPEDIPSTISEPDNSKKRMPVIVDFGDSFFLHEFLSNIGYLEVLKSIKCSNFDTLLSLIYFYTLDCGVASEALSWYKQNYASYLCPKANLYSQRISETLKSIGSPESVREFITAHIKYILDNTDEDLSVLIDSTGLPNKSNLDITKFSNHEGVKSIEFRLIAVVQKSTGLPLYYEYIAGNIIDINTLERTIKILCEHNCKVQYCIGDSGYCNQDFMVKMICKGIEFMTRLNPAYNLFKKAFQENKNSLLHDMSHVTRYNDRLINVIKIPTVVGYDKKTNQECKGYVYLCMDLQARASKIDHFFTTKNMGTKTSQEIIEEQEKYGVFAILTTRDLPVEEVIPEYYVRQGVEQYFDFAKNYANILPVRQQNIETQQGHLLLSFISSFIFVLIKNRLGTAGKNYVEIRTTQEIEEQIEVEYTDSKGEQHNAKVLKQDPVKEASKISSKWLFHDLRGQKADVFKGRIIPSVPTAQARAIYKAFDIQIPNEVERQGLKLKVKESDNKNRTKALAFSRNIYLTDQEILKKRKQQKNPQSKQNVEHNDKVRRSIRGRPKGSKNKKTLEKEALIAAGKIIPETKHKIGRPKGSKNKKTLEKEALIASGKIQPPVKRKPGRPVGSKDSNQRIRRTRQELAILDK